MREDFVKAFEHVHADDALKQNTARLVAQKLHKKQALKQRFKVAIPVFCLVFVMLFGSVHFYATPASAIEISSQSVIQLKVNCFDRVIDVVAQDAQGEKIVQTIQLLHMNYSEAVNKILTYQAQNGEQDVRPVVTVIGDDEKHNQKVIGAMQRGNQKHVEYRSMNKQHAQTAKQKGVSVSKYSAFLTLQAQGADITLNEIKGMSMRQIRDIMENFSPQNQNDFTPPYGGQNRQHQNPNRQNNKNRN